MRRAAAHILDVDRPPIAWREAGHGPLVLLLHGLGGSRTAWGPQLAGLSDRWRLVAWDLPGYGASVAPEAPLTFGQLADAVARLLDALHAEAAHVVGLSFGGMVAQHAALAHPDRVRSLALLATSPAFGLDGTRPQDWRAARLSRLDAGETPADMARDVIAAVAGPGLTEGALEDQVAAMARIDAVALRRAIGCLVTHDLRGRLEDIGAPTLVATGEHDTETPPAYGRYLAEHIPGARFVLLQAAGHLLHVETPEALNAVLARHLAAVDEDGTEEDAGRDG